MSYQIEIINEAGFSVEEKRLIVAISTTLDLQQADQESALTVVITDNDEVAALNLQYRGIDSPTDVLSFPAEALPDEIIDEPPYLGDLIIAFPYASAQAEREGHDLQDSLSLLVVHGTLHLLGFDHDTMDRRAEMWAAQEAALIALSIPTHIVPELEGTGPTEEDDATESK